MRLTERPASGPRALIMLKTTLSLALYLVLPSGGELAGLHRSQERTAFVGATVHTMVPGETPRILTLVLEGERIVALAEDLELAPGTRQIDVAGRHIVPGLIDAYAHFDPDHDALYTAVGVTCVRDVGGDRLPLLLAREPRHRNRIPGPALLTAGALIGGDPPVTPQAVSLQNEHSAEKFLPILFDEEVDFLSIHPSLPPTAWRKTIELAHAQDLEVWGPPPAGQTIGEAIAAGQDGFHFLDGLKPDGVSWDIVQGAAFRPAVAALKDSKRPLVPLLVVSAILLENQGQGAAHLSLLDLLDPIYESWWKAELADRIELMSPENRTRVQRMLDKKTQLVGDLAREGVTLLPGSAGAQPWLFPGQALHRELALWVEAGMPRGEVLQRATRGAAQALGLEGERGALFVGALADLICVSADPREDLGVLLDPDYVCVRGRVLERRDLADLLETLAARKRALRSDLQRPLEIAAPPGPRTFGEQQEASVESGDALVLDGTVETRLLGQRISGERFQVWQLAGGGTGYCGRIRYPSADQNVEREVVVIQVLHAGELQSCYATLRQADMVLESCGLWVAGTWRTRTRFNGQPLRENESIGTHPRCVDLSSVTSLLILGQTELGARIPVLHMREGLEVDSVTWMSELDDRGNHQVRTPFGQLAFRLNEKGAPERVMQRRGTGVLETSLRDFDAFGGGGLPLPPAKKAAPASASGEAEED